MTKLFSRKEMLSRLFGARKAKRLEASLQASGQADFLITPYCEKTTDSLKAHFVFVNTKEGHKFWWRISEKLEKLGYKNE